MLIFFSKLSAEGYGKIARWTRKRWEHSHETAIMRANIECALISRVCFLSLALTDYTHVLIFFFLMKTKQIDIFFIGEIVCAHPFRQ